MRTFTSKRTVTFTHPKLGSKEIPGEKFVTQYAENAQELIQSAGSEKTLCASIAKLLNDDQKRKQKQNVLQAKVSDADLASDETKTAKLNQLVDNAIAAAAVASIGAVEASAKEKAQELDALKAAYASGDMDKVMELLKNM